MPSMNQIAERVTIETAYLLGFTGSEIAEAVHRCDDFVWRVIRDSGVARRSRRKGRADPIQRKHNIDTVRDMLAAHRRVA